MCEYKYKNKSMGHKIGSPCIYSNLKDKIYNEEPLSLLIDNEGNCIFHSNNLVWKKANDFNLHLKALIKFYEKDSPKLIDFSEIIFINSDENNNKICFSDLKFNNYIDMSYCTFHEDLLINNCDLVGLDILGGKFKKYSNISNCSIRSLNFSKSVFEDKFSINKTKIDSYSDFEKCTFSDTISFIDVEFGDMVQFNWAVFSTKDLNYCITTFKNVKFSGHPLDFSNAKFNSCVVFNNVEFDTDCLFINSEFNSPKNSDSSCGALDFSNITIGKLDKMTFIGTESNKLFSNEVRFTNLKLTGEIIFENVNYNQLSRNTRDLFSKLEKEGKIIIKKGCIKYRFQSELKEIFIQDSNQDLIYEIAKTYRNYFVVHNGLNLGLEIYERTTKKISYFFFTDEDITKEIFDIRLEDTFVNFWELFTNIPKIASQLQEKTVTAQNQTLPSKLINSIDIVIDLVGILAKIGARVPFLKLSKEDIFQALVHSVNFGSVSTLNSNLLEITVVNNYNQFINGNNNNQSLIVKK